MTDRQRAAFTELEQRGTYGRQTLLALRGPYERFCAFLAWRAAR